MRIALILCPAWSREMPHLALALLSACLRKDGHQVFNFDLNNDFYHNCIGEYKGKWKKAEDEFWTDYSSVSKFISANEEIIDRAVKQILASNAQMIGFSVYYPTELMSLELARRIKELDQNRIIVLGGAECLREFKGEIFIRKEEVDAVVVGEGELTLSELTKMVDEDKKIDFCEGMLFKKDREVIDCGNRAPIMDLDNLPFSDFTDFPLSRYEYPHTLPLLSSRGCIQRCAFCTVGIFWKRYRCMSGKRIFREVEQQLKLFKSVDDFHFYDPLLNGNIEELSRFCDLIIENTEMGNLPSIKWRGEAIIRPEMAAEILRKMREAGCYDLAYGIESGSQRVLDKMRKHFKISDAQRIIRQTHEAGIKVTLNFMFGFPTETNEDFEKTLDFISRNSSYIDVVLPSDSFCSIDRNTYLYNHPEEFGIMTPTHSSFWETIDGRNTYPERLRRFEAFCELASSLNINIGIGYDKIKLNREQYLESYLAYKEENSLLNNK